MWSHRAHTCPLSAVPHHGWAHHAGTSLPVGFRTGIYYYPEETLRALVDVLRHFVMPAADLVPDYDGFIRELYASGVFGRRQYGEEVVRPALAQLGVSTIRAVETGISGRAPLRAHRALRGRGGAGRGRPKPLRPLGLGRRGR
jgi:hypothetical protein